MLGSLSGSMTDYSPKVKCMNLMVKRLEEVCKKLTSDQIEQVFDACDCSGKIIGTKEHSVLNVTEPEAFKMLKYIADHPILQGEEHRINMMDYFIPPECWKITEEDINEYVKCFGYVGWPKKLHDFIEEVVGDDEDKKHQLNHDIIVDILKWWMSDWNCGGIKEGSKC